MYAMSLVDYPTVSLFKCVVGTLHRCRLALTLLWAACGRSAKPLAVLGVAVIARRADVYNSKQKVMVVLVRLQWRGWPSTRADVRAHQVSLGLGLFFMAKEGVPRVVHPHWSGMSDAALGYCALLGALLLDGLAALAAVAIQCSPTPPSPYHLQLYVNMWSFVTVLASAVLSGRLYEAADFLSRFPSALWMLLKLATLSGIGQLFIFGTMMAFNPLVLSLVTTTRKFFTILVSSVVFAHAFHPLQWVAVAILFGGLLWRDVFDLAHSWVSSAREKRDLDIAPMRGSSIVSAV